MIINATQYAGLCTCADAHRMTTRLAVIEAGCMAAFDHFAREQELGGRRAVIYDENTYHAAGLIRPRAEQEIVLPTAALRADEHTASYALSALRADTELLIAVGGGTVHEIVRYCARKLGLPFIACPTAASTDGYAASWCEMTQYSLPRTLPGTAPTLVLADVNVLSAAPPRLARAGIGEALGKFTALADWRIAHLFSGEPLCPVAEALALQAAVAAQGCCESLARGDSGAIAQLMYALLLSGLSMQMLGERHPGFSAAHHLSRLIDTLPEPHGAKPGILHGEQVGVSAVAVAELYHRIGAVRDIGPLLLPYRHADRGWLADRLGEPLAGALYSENEPDCLAAIDPKQLIAHWESIRRILSELPASEALSRSLRSVRGKSVPKDLGLSDERLPEMLETASYTANQPTLLRMLRLLDISYGQSADASRAPSRSKRYADSAITRAGSRRATSASSIR